MITETHRITSEGVVIDLLLWRRFHRETPGLLEQVLDMNPGLADFGAFIPVGTEVVIPIPEQKAPTMKLVKLWD